jgi:DNA repair exonuclease SbcCD nuclease subunit
MIPLLARANPNVRDNGATQGREALNHSEEGSVKAYAVVSDLHCHNFSAYASTNADGVNTRLRHILDEFKRAAEALKAAGGDRLVIAGDLFHQRGAIHPSVFNPTNVTIREILASGVRIDAIPGNHDLASKDTTELGNSFQSFASLDGFTIHTKSTLVEDYQTKLFIPWFSNLDDLRAVVEGYRIDAANGDIPPLEEIDLFIHAGINGVLAGMPDHGLDAAEVEDWGFNRVFAGHYHNHKVMRDGKVISIGATTHQTWGDIGTKAGFLIVHPEKVVYQASHAPNFVEINEDTDPDEIPLIVDGNYARIRGLKITDSEVKALKTELEGYGCRGVTFQVVREAVTARAATARGLTIDASVEAYIDGLGSAHTADVKAGCAAVLANVRALAA